MVTLLVPVKSFWPTETRKELNFLRCILVFDLVLKCCSDINDWNWMQLFFYLFVLLDIVASVVGTCFFSCVSRFRVKFFLFALWGNVCSWFPKLIWSQMDWVCGSFFELNNNSCYKFCFHSFNFVATVKLLSSLRFWEVFLLHSQNWNVFT